ncbi:uncharacterized protein C1orf53 homolog isoform X2 [Melanotaenia boesemani]|uniref:uncharacterized protein C1orf53 homolog isoform X2 n=1 Tax=Melanotaenia boesemani TaxID=1250792 RepID=UPI001C0585C6|nr:uncharacterized protein C1orf53 homolog isoform X2 [Melanotaenia boesemani]
MITLSKWVSLLSAFLNENMFHKNCPSKAFLSRLILLRVQFNKRLVTMSISNPSEERNSERQGSSCALQIDESRSAAGFCDAVTGCERATAHKFTEEEMTIHRIHSEACEAKKQMYVDPSSGYKVFTEYAHLQRGKCCGSACRHAVS